MVAIVTFLTVMIIAFYGIGKSDNRNHTQKLSYFFDNPFVFALFGLIPTTIAIVALLYFRSRKYIVAFHFDDEQKELTVAYRGLMSKKIETKIIPYANLMIKEFKERKILFNQPYSGISILQLENNTTLDFVSNNFIWEQQPRERVYFLQKIEEIGDNTIPSSIN